jgi:hypothetical protein
VRRPHLQLAIAAAAYAGLCTLVLMSRVLTVGGMLSVPPVGAIAIASFAIVHVVLGATVWSPGVCAVPFLMPTLSYLLQAHIPPDSDIPQYNEVVFLLSVLAVVPGLSLILIGSVFARWREGARSARS